MYISDLYIYYIYIYICNINWLYLSSFPKQTNPTHLLSVPMLKPVLGKVYNLCKVRFSHEEPEGKRNEVVVTCYNMNEP